MKKKYYITILGIVAFVFLNSCSTELEEPKKKEIHTELFSKTKAMSNSFDKTELLDMVDVEDSNKDGERGDNTDCGSGRE